MSLLSSLCFALKVARSNLGELPFPYRLTFMVTSRCQLRCGMCNIWQSEVQDELTHAEIDSLFSRAPKFSWINLTGGELFLRPDIDDILRSIVRHSPRLHLLNFPTNGVLTDKIVAAVDMLLRESSLPRLIVSVSLDGPENLHDSIRGQSGTWGHAMATFAELRRRRSRRFSVYLGYTLQSANLNCFDETLAACQSILPGLSTEDFHLNLAQISGHYYDNVSFAGIPAASQAGCEFMRISRLRRPKLLDPVGFIERRYQQFVPSFLQTGRAPFPCQAAAASCFIDATGRVYPCTGIARPIGSLREYDVDFTRLWQTQIRTHARDQVRQGNCPQCWTPCEAYQNIMANLLR